MVWIAYVYSAVENKLVKCSLERPAGGALFRGFLVCPWAKGTIVSNEKAHRHLATRRPSLNLAAVVLAFLFLCSSVDLRNLSRNLKPTNLGPLFCARLRFPTPWGHWSPVAGLEGKVHLQINRHKSKIRDQKGRGPCALGPCARSFPFSIFVTGLYWPTLLFEAI